MDTFDIILAFEGLETAVEDRLVNVGSALNGADPNARAASRMNDIVDQAFVGTEILESGAVELASR